MSPKQVKVLSFITSLETQQKSKIFICSNGFMDYICQGDLWQESLKRELVCPNHLCSIFNTQIPFNIFRGETKASVFLESPPMYSGS